MLGNIESLDYESKKDKLNYSTIELLKIIDMIIGVNDDTYFNYQKNTITDDQYIIEEYKLIRLAQEKLKGIFK